jgi:hypothetical protein
MNMEARALTNPIVYQLKFVEIQEADNRLDAMFEADQTTKKEMRGFKTTVQDTYVHMNKLDYVAETKW